MSLVSVVVPVYQNAGSLEDLFRRLIEAGARSPKDTFEYLFVDDGSRDASLEVLKTLAGRDPRVRVIKLSRNFGSWAAILAGLAHATGEAALVIAADLQDPPELIPSMIAAWRTGKKVVLAARQSRADPFLNRLLADAFYRLFRRYAIPQMPRHGFDFFLLDRQALRELLRVGETNSNLPGLIIWLGYAPALLHYDRASRPDAYGPSMWSLGRRITYFVDSFVAFSSVPLRTASALGVLFATLGGAYAAVIVFLRLFHGAPVEGWASLMVVVLVVSGVQMLMVGILREYLWRTLESSRRRPRFIVDEVIGGATGLDARL